MNNNNQKPQAGEESAETRLLCELQRIVADLAEWSERWPRTRIHSARLQDQMDGELRALEDRAIAAAAKPHNAPTADSGRLPDAPCSAATPETDALEASDSWQWDDMRPPAPYRRMAELCRQMEQERDTARRCMEYLEVWKAALEQPNANSSAARHQNHMTPDQDQPPAGAVSAEASVRPRISSPGK